MWCGVIEEHSLDRIRRRIRQDLRCHHFILVCDVGLRVLCNHAEFLAAAQIDPNEPAFVGMERGMNHQTLPVRIESGDERADEDFAGKERSLEGHYD